MSAAPALALGPADQFARLQRPRLEAALAASVTGLGDGLAWVERAATEAVGTRTGGGRRWRPLLVLAGAQASGRAGEAALQVAVAAELTHTASLVLDDLPCMDDTDVRRGHAATHRLVGSGGAILVAIGLLGRAAECLGGAGAAGGTLAREWGVTVGLDGMAGGQAVDVALSGDARGAARRLYRRKTTALAAFAAAGGACAEGANADTVAALRGFGTDLGWAYQLADDVADAGEDDAAGRAAGGCRPTRQAAFLLRRARRRVAGAPGLTPAGRALLLDVARTLVSLPGRGH